MPACPAGHDSATSDYCDVCGAPLAPPPTAAIGAADEPSRPAGEPCPGCGSPRTGRFCEDCGHDFEAPAAWTAVVAADRSYFDQVTAGPGTDPLTFPPDRPVRTFALTADQIRVGRRSVSRGITPEIDLTGPPLDPGLSHLHVLLNRIPDGSWQLVDPGSANGTRINDSSDPVSTNEPVALADGDRIHIGA
jgi:FHA domain-containing protein